MTVRATYVGTQRPLQVFTAANHAKGPGGWLGYAMVTADQGSITTEVDLTGAAVQVEVGANRLLLITATVHMRNPSAAGGWRVYLKEQVDGGGYTTVQAIAGLKDTATTQETTQTMKVFRAIDAATVDYKLTAEEINPGTVESEASATQPLVLLVEDIGSTA